MIKKTRKETGLSQAQFAELLANTEITVRIGDVRGISQAQISLWENSNRNPDKLIQLSLKKIRKNKKKTLQNKNR